MHGAGNDYVLLDARDQEQDWPSLARAMCDRHYGIGSDGLLLVAPSRVADVRMRMLNPDGSEAEMCGNGIRCFSKYVLERDIVSPSNGNLTVETGAGVLDVQPFRDGDGTISRARVSMGEPRFHADDVPVRLPEGESGLRLDISVLDISDGIEAERIVVSYPVKVAGQTFNVNCVSMGNPHAVAFLDVPVDDVPLDQLGPLMEHHPLFPQHVNFHVVNVQGTDWLKARTWERGAGLTLACGTGACAIQAAARLLRLTDETVAVEMPGGMLSATWTGQGPVYLEGPAQEVYQGEWQG